MNVRRLFHTNYSQNNIRKKGNYFSKLNLREAKIFPEFAFIFMVAGITTNFPNFVMSYFVLSFFLKCVIYTRGESLMFNWGGGKRGSCPQIR